KDRINRKRKRAYLVQGVEQSVNRGVAELRIRRVRKLAARFEFIAENAFGAERELVLRRLAVDEKARATRRGGGGFRADAAALFADDEEQREIAHAGGGKIFGGADHGGDNAFGIARAAAVDVRFVFAGGKEGRDGVQMRGQRNDGLTKGEKEIVAVRLRSLTF